MGSNAPMIFGKPIHEVIRSRRSVRTYKDQALTPDIKKMLEDYINHLSGPFHIKIRLMLVETDIARKTANANLGTYGIIKGASAFLVSAVCKTDRALEETGYVMENVILYAASLGLGTCWLGGTFKKSEFSKAIDLKENEFMPAVTPVGYPAENRSLTESLMRFAAGSKNRKGWSDLFFKEDFSQTLDQTSAGKYAEPLEMVRLAPSASNKQPWRIIKQNRQYHFYLQHAKGYARMMDYDIQKLDLGIAMCHFELTAREQGLDGSWDMQIPHISNVSQDMEYIISWIGE